MAWGICIGIWLMTVAILIAFFYGEFGLDTKAKKEQD